MAHGDGRGLVLVCCSAGGGVVETVLRPAGGVGLVPDGPWRPFGGIFGL